MAIILVSRFADALIRNNPDDAAKMTADFLKVTPPVAKRVMGLVTFDITLNKQTADGLVMTSNWLVGKGKIKPIDYKAFIYPDLLRKVKPDAVSFSMPGG